MGGAATSAKLNSPIGIVIDATGNIDFTDYECSAIHKINTATGIMTLVAGNRNYGYSGDGGPATNAELNEAEYLTLDANGNMYVADRLNYRIRRIDSKTGIITTVAGDGTKGFSGDGGLAISAELNPISVAVDDSNNLYIVDNGNRVRKVYASTGIIVTIAGNGTNVYNGDSINAITAGIGAIDIVLDSVKNMYLSDIDNYRIRKISAKTNIITTIAGNGTEGNSGDGGLATAATIHLPTGIALDKNANLYIADNGNNSIRKVDMKTGIIITIAHN